MNRFIDAGSLRGEPLAILSLLQRWKYQFVGKGVMGVVLINVGFAVFFGDHGEKVEGVYVDLHVDRKLLVFLEWEH